MDQKHIPRCFTYEVNLNIKAFKQEMISFNSKKNCRPDTCTYTVGN